MTDLNRAMREFLVLGLFLVSVIGRPAGGGINDVFSAKFLLKLNGMWKKHTTPSVTPPCTKTQCHPLAADLCQNGGVCEVTNDCTEQCKCPKGFTGYFCGVKATPDLTTLSMDITTSIHRTLSTAYKKVKEQLTPTEQKPSTPRLSRVSSEHPVYSSPKTESTVKENTTSKQKKSPSSPTVTSIEYSSTSPQTEITTDTQTTITTQTSKPEKVMILKTLSTGKTPT